MPSCRLMAKSDRKTNEMFKKWRVGPVTVWVGVKPGFPWSLKIDGAMLWKLIIHKFSAGGNFSDWIFKKWGKKDLKGIPIMQTKPLLCTSAHTHTWVCSILFLKFSIVQKDKEAADGIKALMMLQAHSLSHPLCGSVESPLSRFKSGMISIFHHLLH